MDFKVGDSASGRCTDPHGNEHKIYFTYTGEYWEITDTD